MLTFAPEQEPRIRVLTEEKIERIHAATLEILGRIGMEVKNARGLELLAKAGAKVEGSRVWIPEELVEGALASAPERVVMHNRLGEAVMPLEEYKVSFGTGSDTPSTIDPYSGERRRPMYEDVKRLARLCDGLEEIDFVMTMGIVNDVPPAANYVAGFAAMMEGTVKPLVFTANNTADMEKIYKMACAAAGGAEALRERPFLLHYAEPISPLVHSPDGVAKLLYCADKRIPVAYVSGMTGGGTGPATLAGALSLANAECLAGLVMHQLAAEGAPFIYGGNVTVLDMATTACVYSSPEWRVTDTAFAELARHYRKPVWATAGNADSKVVDAQAGAEAMMSLCVAMLSRGNLVHDLGYIASGLTSSPEMIVLAHEIIGMLKVFVRGMEIDDERLALKVIEAVGPGGHYMAEDHTVEYFRKDHFLGRLIDRQNFDNWSKGGSLDMKARLNRKVKEILEIHKTTPLGAEAAKVVKETLAEVTRKEA